MILYMFRASHAHLEEDIVYLQYLVSSRSVCCHTQNFKHCSLESSPL
jgi:hypothetical protein